MGLSELILSICMGAAFIIVLLLIHQMVKPTNIDDWWEDKDNWGN